jgi:hypothetical protein
MTKAVSDRGRDRRLSVLMFSCSNNGLTALGLRQAAFTYRSDRQRILPPHQLRNALHFATFIGSRRWSSRLNGTSG